MSPENRSLHWFPLTLSAIACLVVAGIVYLVHLLDQRLGAVEEQQFDEIYNTLLVLDKRIEQFQIAIDMVRNVRIIVAESRCIRSEYLNLLNISPDSALPHDQLVIVSTQQLLRRLELLSVDDTQRAFALICHLELLRTLDDLKALGEGAGREQVVVGVFAQSHVERSIGHARDLRRILDTMIGAESAIDESRKQAATKTSAGVDGADPVTSDEGDR